MRVELWTPNTSSFKAVDVPEIPYNPQVIVWRHHAYVWTEQLRQYILGSILEVRDDCDDVELVE